MNPYDFVPHLRETVNGTTAVTVLLETNLDAKGKMRTTNNPFAGMGITKRETLNGIIGYSYANSVNRLASKEGKEEREVKPHPWGDMDAQRLFRIHRKTGEPYLSMKVQKQTVIGYFAPDGTEFPANVIEPFIPVPNKSSTQEDLDGEVIAKDFSLHNIREIKAFGTVYKLDMKD